MLKPRSNPDFLDGGDLKFIGGTEHYDLWFSNGSQLRPPNNEYPLRVNNISGRGYRTWDVFKLPLRSNPECGSGLPPEYRGVKGYWDDVVLLYDDVDMIETYLQCFAPWVMEQSERPC